MRWLARLRSRWHRWRQERAWRRLVWGIEQLDRQDGTIRTHRYTQADRVGRGMAARLMELEAYATKDEQRRMWQRVIVVPIPPWESPRAFVLHLLVERVVQDRRLRALSEVPR